MIKVRIVISLALLVLAIGATVMVAGMAGGGDSLGQWLAGVLAVTGLMAMAANRPAPRKRVRRG